MGRIEVSEENYGKLQTLETQINKIARENMDLRSKTDRSIVNSANLMGKFLAENYGTQKIQNITTKHVTELAKELKDKGYSTSYIKTTVSNLQTFQHWSGSKNKLVESKEILNKAEIDKRVQGKTERAWSEKEYTNALNKASLEGRKDVEYACKLAKNFGLRIEGITTLRAQQIEKAIQKGELTVKEKGGFVRTIPVETKAQEKLLKELKEFCKENSINGREKIFIEGAKALNPTVRTRNQDTVTKAERRIQNWIYKKREAIQDKDRVSGKIAEKSRENGKVEKTFISLHGLRHTYTQTTIKSLEKQYKSKDKAKRETSERLGHHRKGVTNIYLCKKK